MSGKGKTESEDFNRLVDRVLSVSHEHVKTQLEEAKNRRVGPTFAWFSSFVVTAPKLTHDTNFAPTQLTRRVSQTRRGDRIFGGPDTSGSKGTDPHPRLLSTLNSRL